MNEQSKNALAKWREENKGIKVQVLDPITKVKQNPRSKVLAIRAYCWDCAGGSRTEVTLCAHKDCPLWIHRPWASSSANDSEE